MKTTISETIDGSIKNIIQLKTLDNSLEFSQMFDALQDTPRDFQFKLMDALNSLGQTMGIPPTECFDKVLCASEDENPDVKKTMYNWWRAFFEVLGKLTDGKVPNDKNAEFIEKVDALMAEIMKSGDRESSDGGNEVVLEDFEQVKEGYEEANKEEENDMLREFDFAVQHIGEIANKVKDIVNFVNPYCETKEVYDTMKKKTNERGGFGLEPDWEDLPDDWGSWNNYDGDEDDEGYDMDSDDYEMSDDEKRDAWRSRHKYLEKGNNDDFIPMKDIIGMTIGESIESLSEEEFLDAIMDEAYDTDDVFEVYDGFVAEDGSVALTVIVNKVNVEDGEVEAEFKDMPTKYGWEYESFRFSSDLAGDEGTETIVVYFRPMKKGVNESWHPKYGIGEVVSWKDENDEMQDGWKVIGCDVNTLEYHLEKDGEDVWVDDVRVEEYNESKQVSCESDWGGKSTTRTLNFTKYEVDGLMDYIAEEIAHLEGEASGLNIMGIVPKRILEYIEMKGLASSVKKLDPKEVIIKWADDSGVDDEFAPAKGNSKSVYDLVKDIYEGNSEYSESKVALEGSEDEQKPDEVKDGEKKFKKDGETKTLVTGSDKDINNKQEVTEMTIEQEVSNPWNLAELMWGQGKENLEELLRADVVDEEYLMQMLEDMDIHNLTSLNDAFAFDFESILEMVGCDPHAWSQNLEIKKAGDDSEEEED